LRYTVDWGNTKPFFVGGTWTCKNAKNPREACPDMKKLRMQRSAGKTEAEMKESTETDIDNRSGKLVIMPGAFPAGYSAIFTIQITKGYICKIQIDV